LGLAFYVGKQYTDAIGAFNRMANLLEFDYAYLAACCVGLGEIKKAKSYIECMRRIRPRASIRYYEKSQPYKNDSDLQRFLEALRKAGLN
jgi:tetratricopeptide (TPR) repeat protein